MHRFYKDKQQTKPSLKVFYMSIGEPEVFKVVIMYKDYREFILKQNGVNKWLTKKEREQILFREEFQIISVNTFLA